MGLFNKKKEETNSCCCVGNCTPKTMAKTEASKSGVGVKVLGSGCVKCKTPGRIEIAQGYENHRNTQHLKITPVSPASVQL